MRANNLYKIVCFILFTILILPFPLLAEQSIKINKSRSSWLWLLPGGGQFYLGQTSKGVGYALGTLGLVGWGISAEKEKESGEINAPLVYAQQVYVTSFYAAHRDMRIRLGETKGPIPVDPSSTSDLVMAPFRWENIKSPWVIGSLLVGAGLNFAITRADSDRRSFRDIRRVRYLGNSFNRDQGSAVYAAYWIPISLGAGVSEEMLFRGVFQSEWERKWGTTKGWVAASGLFGIAHLSNIKDPEAWGNVAFATTAGLYLGWRYQKRGYRLSEPIASHFWFNVAAGITLFLANPEDNPLGAKINYSF